MGFGDKTPVDVKGAKVSPHDLLMKIVRRPSGNFMNENAAMQEAEIPIYMNASVIVESDSGKIGDEAVGRRVRSVSRIDYHPPLFSSVEERRALYKTFGSSQIHVALPAVITAILCAAGKAPSGVAGIECPVPRNPAKPRAEAQLYGIPFRKRAPLIPPQVRRRPQKPPPPTGSPLRGAARSPLLPRAETVRTAPPPRGYGGAALRLRRHSLPSSGSR